MDQQRLYFSELATQNAEDEARNAAEQVSEMQQSEQYAVYEWRHREGILREEIAETFYNNFKFCNACMGTLGRNSTTTT